MHSSDEALVRRAVGEPVPEVDEHAAACAHCRDELAALRAVVVASRAGGPDHLPPPPPAVWARIAQQTGLAVEPPPAAAERRWPRRAVVVGAAAAAAAVVGGVAVVPPSAPPASSTVLAPLVGPVSPTAAGGRARLEARDGTAVLTVTAAGLPDVDGFYEVWLLEPATGRMLALGTLDEDGTARLPVPEEVDAASYPVVDVSVETDDGNPAHSGTSALRGPVPATRS